MKIAYRNNGLERVLTGVKGVSSMTVVASFVLLFGFYDPPVPPEVIFNVQLVMLFIFLAGKVIRLLNAESRREYIVANWYEIPMLAALGIVVVWSFWRGFGEIEPGRVRQLAVGIYLIIEVTTKIFMASVALAATGRNPTKTLVGSFVVLIATGAGLLMLPTATPGPESLRFVDSFFTATSATCVTGLVVRNTGEDFTFLGQIIILVLIQLGALGIMVFGAVLALLLGQAFSLRESSVLQDMLNAQTLSRIGNIIAFIFIVTIVVEGLGAMALLGMWDNVSTWDGETHSRIFYSIFHSISAFCNAGFDLTGSSLVPYSDSWQAYGVFCPLIILGGLGFAVLYNIANALKDRLQLVIRKRLNQQYVFATEPPTRLRLQSKIVLSATIILILVGTVALLFFEHFSGRPERVGDLSLFGAFFQSVTARTAGFNTVPIAELTASSKTILILLMFIGGAPGSTAGGVKNVTLVILLMAVVAMLRKRGEVEIFKRSVRDVVVDRALTVVMLFVVVLFTSALALSVTESPYPQGFTMLDFMFEAASALGTVGLSTGVTPTLTTAGKLIIIVVMLIGRLGPLTMVAALTFNMKPARYNYPDEAIIVG